MEGEVVRRLSTQSVMERLDITYAFNFDNDFAQYGFSMFDAGALP